MKLPDDIEKLKVEAADKWREHYTRPVFACGYEEAFKYGADWGFAQGVLHERKRAEDTQEYIKMLESRLEAVHTQFSQIKMALSDLGDSAMLGRIRMAVLDRCNEGMLHCMLFSAKDQYLKSGCE